MLSLLARGDVISVGDSMRLRNEPTMRPPRLALLLLLLCGLLVGARFASASCPAHQFQWPAGKNYCWRHKDSARKLVGPGPNIFAASNANVAANGDLSLQIDFVGGKWRSGEVILNRSLGLGDYVFVVRTDPWYLDRNLVLAPFLYANDSNEVDIEFSRWGDPQADHNSQFTLQPFTRTGAQKFYNLRGQMSTHRIRWVGKNIPGQIRFESYKNALATPVASFSPSGGDNFVPGNERVRFNFWLYRDDGATRPFNNRTNVAAIACFRFCPLPAGCSALGVKPTCP